MNQAESTRPSRGWLIGLLAITTVVAVLITCLVMVFVMLPWQQRITQERVLLNSLPADAIPLVESLRMATPEEKASATRAVVPDKRAYGHIYVATEDFRTVATATPMMIIILRDGGARWMGGPLGRSVILFQNTSELHSGTTQYDWLCHLALEDRAKTDQCLDPQKRNVPTTMQGTLDALRPFTQDDDGPYWIDHAARGYRQQHWHVIKSDVVELTIAPARTFTERRVMLFPYMSNTRIVGGELGLHAIMSTPDRALEDELCYEHADATATVTYPFDLVGPEITAHYQQLCPRI